MLLMVCSLALDVETAMRTPSCFSNRNKSCTSLCTGFVWTRLKFVQKRSTRSRA